MNEIQIREKHPSPRRQRTGRGSSCGPSIDLATCRVASVLFCSFEFSSFSFASFASLFILLDEVFPCLAGLRIFPQLSVEAGAEEAAEEPAAAPLLSDWRTDKAAELSRILTAAAAAAAAARIACSEWTTGQQLLLLLPARPASMGPLDPGAAYGTFFCTVFGFGLFVVYGARHESLHALLHPDSSFLAAGKSVSWGALGLSLYASFMGNWVLFLPPITGAMYGWPGVAGYAISSSLPHLLVAWLSPRVYMQQAKSGGFCGCDHLAVRCGRAAQLAAAAVSLCSMLVTLASELTTVGMSMSALTGGAFPLACSVVLVAAVPLAYVLVGGLKCSIISDVVQGVIIVFLFLPFVVYLICTGSPAVVPSPEAAATGAFSVQQCVIAAAVLVLSVWPVFLSDQGIWQRVWAARSVRDIRLGFLLAGLLSGASVFLFGVAGLVCLTAAEAMQGGSLFTFAAVRLPAGWVVLLCILALTCVISSVDTYEAALVSLVGQDLARLGLSFNWARGLMVLLNVPAVLVALFQVPLMSLFMVSNFLCSALAGPFLVSVHPKLTRAGFLGGLVCALVGLLVCGVCACAANGTAFSFAFFAPDDISTLPYAISFLLTPIVGAAAAAGISFCQRSCSKTPSEAAAAAAAAEEGEGSPSTAAKAADGEEVTSGFSGPNEKTERDTDELIEIAAASCCSKDSSSPQQQLQQTV
ncbi:hypothetical protein Efla_003754 [Eimeria flavescens]